MALAAFAEAVWNQRFLRLAHTAAQDNFSLCSMVSTGLSDTVLGVQVQEETHHGILTKYVPDDPYQYILGYPGAVLFICGDADETGAYDNTAFNVTLYQQREQAQTDFVTISGGRHGYGAFTKEQRQTTVDCILSWMAQ